ncbi:uncharacterized protein LOC144579963 [Callithrix jacchus]
MNWNSAEPIKYMGSRERGFVKHSANERKSGKYIRLIVLGLGVVCHEIKAEIMSMDKNSQARNVFNTLLSPPQSGPQLSTGNASERSNVSESDAHVPRYVVMGIPRAQNQPSLQRRGGRGVVKAPRRAGRGDEQVAKLDRAPSGAAAQLLVRDLLRGHGESLRVRVGGMPGLLVAPRPGRRRVRNLPQVRPQPGARAAPGARGGCTDLAARGGAPRPPARPPAAATRPRALIGRDVSAPQPPTSPESLWSKRLP